MKVEGRRPAGVGWGRESEVEKKPRLGGQGADMKGMMWMTISLVAR